MRLRKLKIWKTKVMVTNNDSEKKMCFVLFIL
jgi:hypothetical protein